jgi:hypothetical protein
MMSFIVFSIEDILLTGLASLEKNVLMISLYMGSNTRHVLRRLAIASMISADESICLEYWTVQ